MQRVNKSCLLRYLPFCFRSGTFAGTSLTINFYRYKLLKFQNFNGDISTPKTKLAHARYFFFFFFFLRERCTPMQEVWADFKDLNL